MVSVFGFYGGGGTGFIAYVSNYIFINAENEIAYVTNSCCRNILLQSASAGIGVRF